MNVVWDVSENNDLANIFMDTVNQEYMECRQTKQVRPATTPGQVIDNYGDSN